jgi:diguanylate cyclase (GGDEF)-like protein
MPKPSVTLDSVEAFLGLRHKRGLTFPPDLERQFEADMSDRRSQRLTSGILVSAIIYNLFLIADWLLVPDVFWRAVVLHFAVVTPWMLAAAWLVSRRLRPLLRESLAASIPLLIFLQIEYGFASTASETAAHYQYVVIPTLLYTNVSLHRLVFPFACLVTMVIVVCHSGLALNVSYLSPTVGVMMIVQLLVCGYVTLIANYRMERDLRRAYLYSLRDRLRHAQADAASKRDALTGLANRHHLEDELQSLWADRKHEGAAVSIVLVDIDHFKHLNDRYGHGAGDLCLKRVAAILTSELRGAEDHAVRFGGEEFLLLLPDTQMVDAMRVAERTRRAIEKAAIPNEGANVREVVTASFGVASASVADLTAAELIAAADSALYAAKRKGRNQVWPPVATGDSPSSIVSIPQRIARGT